MESLSFSNISPFTALQPPPLPRPTSQSYSFNSKFPLSPPLKALKSRKGFGSPSTKSKKRKTSSPNKDEDEDEEEFEKERDDTVIPEIVTNRMMKRMGLSVGIPLSIGLLFFPFFYYLKVVAKIDVPNWIPFIVSFALFGTALLGVSYGIVSASWDPMREGSLLGWNEARRNWPVFWDSLWGGGANK